MSQPPTPASQSPVVASLPNRSPHPYSSIAMSPSRQYAIIAGKDSLQLVKITPNGLVSCKTIQISQHFRTPSVASPDQRSADAGFVQNTFGLGVVTSSNNNRQTSSSRTNSLSHTNVVVTSVSWSMPSTTPTKKRHTSVGGGTSGSSDGDTSSTSAGGSGGSGIAMSDRGEDYYYKSPDASNNISAEDEKDTIIAAAGSNGVVVVWNARKIFFSDENTSSGRTSTTSRGNSGRSSTMGNQQPEATLRQHTRAVNTLAWHPRNQSLLLTASQDATVKLWERRDMGPRVEPEQTHQLRSWFSGAMSSSRSQSSRSYSWHCRSTFEPKSEAVRDIKWSKFQDDVFALVTASGSLIIYSMHVPSRAMAKIAAHTVDATCLDWHPTRPYVIATGGAGDRCVKVWDVEDSVNMKKQKKDDSYMVLNSGTGNTIKSEISMNSGSSSETDRSMPSFSGLSVGYSSNVTIIGGANQTIGSRTLSGLYQGSGSRQKVRTLHVLSISAAVTKLRWRPPSGEKYSAVDTVDEVDRHDSMLAVATARLTSAGGSGILSLWSFHRPFMPLSVVEGHEEGAVTDFFWLDTPEVDRKAAISASLLQTAAGLAPGTRDSRRNRKGQIVPATYDYADSLRSTGRAELESMLAEQREREKDVRVGIWQHVLSVGRDGRCVLQSFARGDRPISRVPPSCFAMANLSPFQEGYGSLQLFSVYQRVPKGPKNDFLLTGLRQDEYTAQAPGVFKETPPLDADCDSDDAGNWVAGRRLPATVPDIVFNIVDQGDLNENNLPAEENGDVLMVGPEVVHLSRFASRYRFYPDERFPTRAEVCLHNGNVAEQLHCGPLARMWRLIASMLSGAGLDELPPNAGLNHGAENVMQFVLLPTVKSLLEERADAGDVQTCVAVCEVLQVIQPDQQIRIPGLELNRVREWYLAYIDLLHQMCLFSFASFLIRSCNDKYIGALSQQSTTIHESCPRCGKPVQPTGEEVSSTARSRRACKNCRRRVGLCFLCHEPVKGIFVWCPGCGHGGHLDHALQWFGGGQKGKAVRELCPTGCGHKCNLSQTLNAFPRTDSMVCMPTTPELEE